MKARMSLSRVARLVAVVGIALCGAGLPQAQTTTPPKPGTGSAIPVPPVRTPRTRSATPPVSPSQVEKLSDSRVRIGSIEVDMAKKEVSVPGVVNETPVLEFLVNTKDGYKSYESAIEADCNAIDFNLGLILIGLDRERATVRPRFHFDPIPPQGDGVEIWVSWTSGSETKRVRADELMYDITSKRVVPAGSWVYTGSRFMPRSTAFLADVDGVLIGFVHTPAPLIERVEPVPGQFGSIQLNPTIGLEAGTKVTLTVRALPVK